MCLDFAIHQLPYSARGIPAACWKRCTASLFASEVEKKTSITRGTCLYMYSVDAFSLPCLIYLCYDVLMLAVGGRGRECHGNSLL